MLIMDIEGIEPRAGRSGKSLKSFWLHAKNSLRSGGVGARDDCIRLNRSSGNSRLQDDFILPRVELDHVVPTGRVHLCLFRDLISNLGYVCIVLRCLTFCIKVLVPTFPTF